LLPAAGNHGSDSIDVIDLSKLIDRRPPVEPVAENDDRSDVRHLLALTKRGQFSAASELTAQLRQNESLERDSDKRTAAHYAALSPQGADLLKLIVQHSGYRCLKIADCSHITPLHLAAARQTADNLREILAGAPKPAAYLAQRDRLGNTVPHYAASNIEHKDAIKVPVDCVGVQCLAWQNAKGQPVLHVSLLNAAGSELQPLLDRAGSAQALTDNGGNSWAHYVAKRGTDDNSVSQLLNRQEILSWQNFLNESVLHLVLKYCSPDTSKKLIKIAGSNIISLRDINGNTCAHYAAMKDGSDDVITEIVKVAEPMCLRMRNVRGELVWHLVLKTCRFQTVKSLMDALKAARLDIPNQADSDGNRSAHFAVLSKVDCDKKINALVTETNAACLRSQNKKGQSVLHLAVRHCSNGMAVQLVGQAKAAVVELRDQDGNTCLHYAAQCERHEIVEAAASRLVDTNCWLWTNRHDQTGDSAAKEFKRLDVDKNTLAHAVFLNDSPAQSTDEFFATLNKVIKAGVDKKAENNMGQTCLHGSIIDSTVFIDILSKAAADAELKKIFHKFLTNSDGVHAVHAFAGRYSLKELAQSLAELSDMQLSEMLQLTVAKGPNKGATSLHFACEAVRPAAAEKTQDGQSCIDFGYDKGKMSVIFGLPGVKRIDLLRLVDPANRSLKLPDRSTARHLLASISDESMRVTIQRDAGIRTTILRSGLRLGLISPRTENCFRDFITEQLKLGAQHTELESFSEKELDEFLSIHALKDDETSEMLIIDFCLHFEKLEILPDLILTRQFQLIPACVTLLIQMRPKISSKKGRHEQLRRLHSAIVCIVVNALDELFVNADQTQKKILFNYILGGIKTADAVSSGPRFPTRSLANGSQGCACANVQSACCSPRRPDQSVDEVGTYQTLFELIKEADCNDLFATDCVYELVKQEWEGRSEQAKTKAASPKAKFYIHLFGFALFLIYFSWYIIDFKTTFLNVWPDIILLLYTLSLTAHELNDFCRSRRPRQCHSRRCKRTCSCPEYFREIFNYFDCSALVFMWLGIVWKLAIQDNPTHPTAYTCQMILSTSYLLWGFRSVSFLSYSELIGPVITMLEHLLIRDLLPFLAIILVIVYSFGVFFFNLLFPVVTALASETSSATYGVDAFVQVYTMPLKLLFTDFPQDLAAAKADISNQSISSEAAHPTGYPVFEHFARYTFLLVCNLVMLNLLIALFNLRVSIMSSKARGIWRRSYFHMLLEYKRSGLVPPPLSFVYYAYKLAQQCYKRRQRSRNVDVETKTKRWWLRESDYPQEYIEILQFQATHFRRSHPSLSRQLEANRSDAEGLKSHTRNALAEVHSELDEALARQHIRLQKLEEQRADDIKELRRLVRRRSKKSVSGAQAATTD
uniref:ANK_REP_REGION domain-containing protein n=1 Tax=Macrostomum lignano TaxID=282301 RepID=A0A1I8I946_9PLAT